jgi:RNA polymerase sigma factor (sigma-70 family)
VANPQLARDIAAVLDELAEIDRLILTARYFEGETSFAEIGGRVGLSENAVRVRHHRLIRRLSEKLSAYAPGARSVAAPPTEEDHEDG